MKKVVWLVLILLVLSTPAIAWKTAVTKTFKNNTGLTAYDLHIHVGTWNDVMNPPIPTSNKFSAVTAVNGGKTIHYSEGTVAKNTTVTVNYTVDDTLWLTGRSIDPSKSYWTDDQGNSIGGLNKGGVSITSTDNGDDTYTVTIDNVTGADLAYANLRLYTGINDAYFNHDDYLAQMTTGTMVALDITNDGILPVGVTTVTTFSPLMYGYTAIAVNVGADNDLFGVGTQIPEPSTLCLLLLGGMIVRKLK